MRAAIGHGTRSHHTAQHDPSAPLSVGMGDLAHVHARATPGRADVLAAGRHAACGRGVARGGPMQRLAARLDRLSPTHGPIGAPPGTCAARAAAAVRARGKRVSARAALVRDGSRGQRSCVWACSGGSGMSMRASPVDLCARRRRPQRPVSACSMEHSACGSRAATIVRVRAAQTACGQGSGVGSARSRRLTSTSAFGWREPCPSANAHEPVTRVMLARESEPRGRVPGRPASPGRAG